MFLRALAKDLYRSQKEVEKLEKMLEGVSSAADQDAIKRQLLKARAELEQIQKMMEGRKEQSRASFYKPKSRFF